MNELIGRVASPEQRAALELSTLDDYVLGEEAELAARRELVASRREPSLEQFIPRRGDGLALSASDIDLYRTCPLKYKFARVFAIPQEPTINQRFGILIHQVLERFHTEGLHADALSAARCRARRPRPIPRGASTGCWGCSRPGGDGPASVPPTTSFSTAIARWPRSPDTTSDISARTRGRCGWSGASRSPSALTSFAAGWIGWIAFRMAATS